MRGATEYGLIRPTHYSRAIIRAADRRNIALHRTRQVLLRVRFHHPLEVVAVDAVERQRKQRRRDGTNAVFGKRDEVRNAAHEREGLAVQVYDGDVRRAHHALAAGARRPMQHRAAGEVSAAAYQRDTVEQFESLAVPEF